MPTLIISEKNKAAKGIAEALGPVTVINKTKFLKVYQIPSKNIYVVPLRGHILEYRIPICIKAGLSRIQEKS